MRLVTGSKLLLNLVLMFLLPIPAHAIPAITCHCFTDRSYDAAHPTAADAYFLATAQNSFFAIVFNIDKKSIVMKKQQGTSSDDLWVAYWVAAKAGKSPDSLFQDKTKSVSWKNVVVSLKLPPKILGARFSNALNANVPTDRLSEAVVDELFLKDQLLGEWDLADVRKAGANNQELIIATVIATKTKQSARQLYLEVKAGTKTWGSLLSWAKIDTKNMQQEVANILKLHPQ
ncbi:MAG: hypothetical protein RW306_10260 [Geobacteraceae bacterium]|nr:hypothetical protein [Geobacteraceae bacterium]